jgi:uncharacterized protein (TIGR02001 family)
MTNDYIYRGYSQTEGDFAIQGGLDMAHSSGFYVGAWGSNVTLAFTDDDGVDHNSSVEVDFYGGFAGEFGNSMFSYDVGFLYYAYPGSQSEAKFDFYELGLTLGADFGPATVSVAAWWSPDFFGGIGNALHVPIGIEVPIPIGDGPVTLSTSANVAFNKYFDVDPADDNTYINWDIGLTLNIYEWFDLDLRYYDTDVPDMLCKGICDSRFVAAISRGF